MKVLIVDDHPVLRDGLAALLRGVGPDVDVLQADGPDQALEAAHAHADIDVVVLDLFLPGIGGLATLAEFGRRRPELPVIVLSSSDNPHDALGALEQGALGYVPKSASQSTLLGAIRLVMTGEVYVPPMILAEVGARAPRRGRDLEDDGRAHLRLTDRQTDVLRLIGEGRTNGNIALTLSLSEKTVKAHVSAIFKTLQVVNRTQAANAGRDAGLI